MRRHTAAVDQLYRKLSSPCGGRVFQVIHDCGTLKNRKSYLHIGLQAVRPDWDGNVLITIAFAELAGGKTDGDIAGLIEAKLAEVFGGSPGGIMTAMVQGGAAMGVGGMLADWTGVGCSFRIWQLVV